MRVLDRLAQLHMVANQHKVLGGETHLYQVAVPDMARFIHEQGGKTLIQRSASCQAICLREV